MHARGTLERWWEVGTLPSSSLKLGFLFESNIYIAICPMVEIVLGIDNLLLKDIPEMS